MNNFEKFILTFLFFLKSKASFADNFPSTIRLAYIEGLSGELVLAQDESSRARLLFFLIGMHYIFALFKKNSEIKLRASGAKNLISFSVAHYMMNVLIGLFGGVFWSYYLKKFISSKYKKLVSDKADDKNSKILRIKT